MMRRERNKTENFMSMAFWGQGRLERLPTWKAPHKALEIFIFEKSKGGNMRQKSFFVERTCDLVRYKLWRREVELPTIAPFSITTSKLWSSNGKLSMFASAATIPSHHQDTWKSNQVAKWKTSLPKKWILGNSAIWRLAKQGKNPAPFLLQKFTRGAHFKILPIMIYCYMYETVHWIISITIQTSNVLQRTRLRSIISPNIYKIAEKSPQIDNLKVVQS